MMLIDRSTTAAVRRDPSQTPGCRLFLAASIAAAACFLGCRPAVDSDALSRVERRDKAATQHTADRRARAPELTHDFGVVRPRSASSHAFLIRNDSDRRETIKRVSRTCSCIATALTKDVIEPGETSELTVEYTAPDVNVDDKRALTVTFAETSSPPLRLVITARVRDVLTASEREIVFADVGRNSRATAHLRVENFGDSQWPRLVASTSSGWLSLSTRAMDTNLPFGLPRQAWDVALFADSSGLSVGTHRADLSLDAPGVAVKLVPVELVVTSPVTAIPAELFLGRVQKGQLVTRTFPVRFASGRTPDKNSTMVRCTPLGLLEAFLDSSDGTFWRFRASFKAPSAAVAESTDDVSFDGEIAVSFGDAEFPDVQVPVHAITKQNLTQPIQSGS